MLLLTGATGLVGSALLRRLIAEGQPVRCLVRDPRRLGPQRVRVQIALGDLADPPSFRNAMRGVDTVVHLAASTRDQPRGSIEELGAIATWRMVEAAQRAGVKRFVFFSTLGASSHHRARLFRAKALAEQAVRESDMHSTVIAPSLVYAPGDRWLTLIERLSLLPVVPISGRGRAACQPIWAEDVASCLVAALRGGADGEATGRDATHRRYELAGPQTMTYNEVIDTVLRSIDRQRPLLPTPTPMVSRTLRLLERVMHANTPITWDEAELLEANMVAKQGTMDAQSLGVVPEALHAVLRQ
ncbi:MAG TPA: NAD(P)H-binding protein [Solirubrobacteraceae bacterium]|jgi:NADH dehydrogenase|nr:NAD(P)H-binding protein [Solirubrobacteraceae bacterium]